MHGYVYALHDFEPQNEDEVPFRAGERIEVIEKDDLYEDGWWQGRNLAGKVGLFPKSYTTPPTAEPITASSSTSSTGAGDLEQPKPPLQPLHEEPEINTSTLGSRPVTPTVRETTNGKLNDDAKSSGSSQRDGEVMKATMTDVQQAIEQLGRSKPETDGTSFSFASTGDRDTETDTDFDADAERESDAEAGEDWHKGARQKLAAKARKAVEEAEKLAQMTGVGRSVVPPIEVELSDESDGEDDHLQSLARYEAERQQYRIPEEDEDEDDPGHLKTGSERTTTTQRGVPLKSQEIRVPPQDETELHTVTPSRTSFPSSSFQPIVSIMQGFSDDTKQNGDAISGSRRASTSSHPPTHTTFAPTPPDLHGKRTSLPSKEAITALPSSTSSSPGNSRSQQNSKHSSLVSSSLISGPSAPTSGPSVPTSTTTSEPTRNEKAYPSDWSVNEVVEWLKGKGFDQDVCDRFTEQEITGDVLLELDINLLKSEIGILAFGKRMRIANAITDLRRPPSVEFSDLQASAVYLHPHTHLPSIPNPHPNTSGNHSRNQSQSRSQLYSYTHGYAQSVLSSGQHSLNSPGFSGPSQFGMIMSPESAPHTGDIPGSPSPVAMFPNPYGDGEVERARPVSDGSVNPARAVGLGIGIPGMVGMSGKGTGRPSQLTLSPSDSALDKTADDTRDADADADADEERYAVSESEAAHRGQSMRRRLFGRSPETGSDKAASRRNSKEITSPLSSNASPISDTTKNLEGSPVVVPRPRTRKSADGSKTSDRLSLFSSTFSGTLGKNRKPPPRYSSSTLEADISAEKGSTLSLSRLYGHGTRKSSNRPSFSNEFPKEGKAFKNDPAKETSARNADLQKEKEYRDPVVLRKRTTSFPSPTATSSLGATNGDSTNMVPLKAGQSILDQIGEPDYKGWMRKKGDRYNTWKLRYFVLKGPHLYYLRSNSTVETKIKGYINIVGYKVVADENANPGRYGFKIIHDHDKPHLFSSDEKSVIREWMKAIMKATIGRDYTKPVISSCNIPTIPLVVAQAMNPAPRPPSPTARDATQKALRRENPHQLSSRDARILMGLPSSAGGETKDERARLESFFKTDTIDGTTMLGSELPVSPPPKSPIPPRPSREMRNVGSVAQISVDPRLIDWANSHLPKSLQITDISGSLCGGLALLRLAESVTGKPSSPPVLDSAFPADSNDDKLDGLFKLFDFLLDNDVKMGSVSINDVRQGKRDKIVQLLKALKAWEDKRRAIVGKGSAAWNGDLNLNTYYSPLQ